MAKVGSLFLFVLVLKSTVNKKKKRIENCSKLSRKIKALAPVCAVRQFTNFYQKLTVTLLTYMCNQNCFKLLKHIFSTPRSVIIYLSHDWFLAIFYEKTLKF